MQCALRSHIESPTQPRSMLTLRKHSHPSPSAPPPLSLPLPLRSFRNIVTMIRSGRHSILSPFDSHYQYGSDFPDAFSLSPSLRRLESCKGGERREEIWRKIKQERKKESCLRRRRGGSDTSLTAPLADRPSCVVLFFLVSAVRKT